MIWLFFPDFRVGNPYQDLLAKALSSDAEVRAGTITDALEAVATTPTIFHVHWEDTLYAHASSESEACGSTEAFFTELAVFRELGGRLVWTVHNAAPHEDRFPALSARVRRALAAEADIVHVHGPVAAGLMRQAGATDCRILVVPHPNLAPAYPNDIDDAAARRYFGLRPEETVFAFLGSMRAYKGLGTLLRAFAEVHRTQPAAQLILAGRQVRNGDARFLMPAPGVRLIPHFVDDGIVQYVLRAADYMVLPYQRILTSGAVALALGFGRPVIIPDLPALLEVVQAGREALVFQAGNEDDLVRCMLDACTHGRQVRSDLGRQARHTAESVTFEHLARALIAGLALGAPS